MSNEITKAIDLARLRQAMNRVSTEIPDDIVTYYNIEQALEQNAGLDPIVVPIYITTSDLQPSGTCRTLNDASHILQLATPVAMNTYYAVVNSNDDFIAFLSVGSVDTNTGTFKLYSIVNGNNLLSVTLNVVSTDSAMTGTYTVRTIDDVVVSLLNDGTLYIDNVSDIPAANGTNF